MKLRVGIVGCGTIAPFHIGSIIQYEHAEIVGLYDVDPSQYDKVDRQHQYRVYESFEAMLQDEVDVVHILTPHHTHYELTKQALLAGKHVLVEKPITIRYEHAAELVELADTQNKYLSVCLQHRTDQTIRYIQEKMNDGSCGNLIGIRGIVHWRRDESYYSQAPWRGKWATEGGGSIINQAIHTLDLMILLAGEPLHLHGVSANYDHDYVEVDDNSSFLLEFPNRVIGIFSSSNSYSSSSPVQMEFTFERVSFHLIGEVLYRETDGELIEVARNKARSGIKSYFGSGHEILIRDFYDSIRNNTTTYVQAKDGLATTHTIERMYQKHVHK